MSVRKKLLIGTLFFLVLVVAALVFNYIRTSSPDYVLNVTARPHELEAEEFLKENQKELSLLVQYSGRLQDTTTYYYTFHVHEFNTDHIPHEMEEILHKLEQRYEPSYVFHISKKEISVSIASETRLEVFLRNGTEDQNYGGEPGWARAKALDNGWTLHTVYIIRS